MATVLQVPLLWGGPAPSAAGSARSTPRHRLPESAAAAATVVPAWEDEPTVPRGRTTHPMLQVVEVGLVSAVLVLALFGAALLALAAWMP